MMIFYEGDKPPALVRWMLRWQFELSVLIWVAIGTSIMLVFLP
jgi:hypothetical protein